jgi:hypothetical protein
LATASASTDTTEIASASTNTTDITSMDKWADFYDRHARGELDEDSDAFKTIRQLAN